jgi:TonB family protein
MLQHEDEIIDEGTEAAGDLTEVPAAEELHQRTAPEVRRHPGRAAGVALAVSLLAHAGIVFAAYRAGVIWEWTAPGAPEGRGDGAAELGMVDSSGDPGKTPGPAGAEGDRLLAALPSFSVVGDGPAALAGSLAEADDATPPTAPPPQLHSFEASQADAEDAAGSVVFGVNVSGTASVLPTTRPSLDGLPQLAAAGGTHETSGDGAGGAGTEAASTAEASGAGGNGSNGMGTTLSLASAQGGGGATTGDGGLAATGRPGSPAGIRGGRARVTPEYPWLSRKHREEGVVLLEVEVLPSGRPGRITVVEDPGHRRLVDAALDAVRREQFTPATTAGRRVTGTLRIPYRFHLR